MALDRRETVLLLTGDFLLLIASLWVALVIRNLALPALSYFESNFVPFLPMFLLSLVVFYISGLYDKQTRPIRRVMGSRILSAQVATVAISAVLFFILPLNIAPKTILILYLIVSVLAESFWRFYRMNQEIAYGKRMPVILVGSGPQALELYEEINGNNKYMIRFVNRIEKNDSSVGEVGGIITMDSDSLYEEIFDRVPLESLDASQLISMLPKHRVLYDVAKRLFDIVLVIAGSVVAIPLVVIAFILLYFQGGSPFIRHERIGKGNRIFRIVKLRSMLFDDHGDSELREKNRVTAFGRFLRKTRIDELPQLWNILVGDLSFIGPRPELPKIAEIYEREIPQYHLRHLIAPGLSGWAQINDADPPKGAADVPRTRRKLSFDLYYLKHRSLGLDLAIASKTLRTLLSFSGT
jgi:lipopolysaccharide/colanic/teichoic acid biosynthesis glycosyltransferase